MTRLLLVLLCCTAFGVINRGSCKAAFAPPYANDHYSCRCLPRFDAAFYTGVQCSQDGFAVHHKMCELRSYLGDFAQHYNAITTLLRGEIDDIAAWLDVRGQHRITTHVSQKKQQIFTAIHTSLKTFPFDALKEKIHSLTLVAALNTLQQEQSTVALEQCWDALNDFAHAEVLCGNGQLDPVYTRDMMHVHHDALDAIEQRITCAYTACKDITTITYSLYRHFAQQCATACKNLSGDATISLPLTAFLAEKNITIRQQFMTVVSTVEGLPLTTTIKKVDEFIKQFYGAISNLEAQTHDYLDKTAKEGDDDKEKNKNTTWWLQEKLTTLPLAVLVVIAKVSRYFCDEGSPRTHLLHRSTTKNNQYDEHEYKPKATEEFYVQN